MERFTVSTKSRCLNWMPETLTAIRSGPPFVSLQLRDSINALRIAQLPTSRIIPVSSRMGMKSPGGTKPRSGSFQRIRASAPARAPLDRHRLGW